MGQSVNLEVRAKACAPRAQGGFNQVGIHMFSLPHAATESDANVSRWIKQRVPVGTWVLQERPQHHVHSQSQSQGSQRTELRGSGRST